MAQGAVAPLLSNGVGAGHFAPDTLSGEELRQIMEYEKIVAFKDAVLAGTHPRIKIPHVVGKQVIGTSNVALPGISTPQNSSVTLPQRLPSTPNLHIEDTTIPFYSKSPNPQRPSAVSYLPMSAKSEINPILLEKSDDLIKAEMHLQRQRLERGLRDDIEKQRITVKAAMQTSESLPNFDISDVLSKALAIVPPFTAADVEPSVGRRSSATDSFDENTFYSSQHDTPELSSSSQGQKEPGQVQSQVTVSNDGQPSAPRTVPTHIEDQDVVLTGASITNDANYAHNQLSTIQHPEQISDSSDSSAIGRRVLGGMSPKAQAQTPSSMATPPNSNQHNIVQRTNQELLRQAFDDNSGPPLIRAHNLSPLAPQPARVSPLATAREPPVLRHLLDEAPSAQVVALRHMGSGISSTDSSPRGAPKGSEKKKEKKRKKRKGKENAATSPDSPYIKPEPRSPSPFAVAPLPRPHKRQRHSGQYAAELNYDEPVPQQRGLERPGEAHLPQEYERFENRYESEHQLQPAYRRVVERESDDYRRASGDQYTRQPQSPAVYTVPYQPGELRSLRAASQAIIDRRAPDQVRYYREPVRAIARPDTDRERSRSPIMRERRSPLIMAPPRRRIVVDEYGNEYVDPAPVAPIRQSMAPPTRYRESDIVYEPHPRAVTRAPVETFEEDGVLYQRPAHTVPRRIVTEPEYAMPAPPEYRTYRQREYSVRPNAMGPPGEEFFQTRVPERRVVSNYEESHREYSRAPSTRPEPIRYEIPRESARPEQVRYEIPRDYAGRLQSVRPEAPPREYAPSVHPESRREMASQYQREYSVRPMESYPPVRREVVGPGGERFYEEVPSRRPAEVAYIERPRAREGSVMVYSDDVRREVYR